MEFLGKGWSYLVALVIGLIAPVSEIIELALILLFADAVIGFLKAKYIDMGRFEIMKFGRVLVKLAAFSIAVIALQRLQTQQGFNFDLVGTITTMSTVAIGISIIENLGVVMGIGFKKITDFLKKFNESE